MGAGASAEKYDAAATQVLAGDKWDQGKFDEIKDADGYITQQQLLSLAPPVEAAAPPESAGPSWTKCYGVLGMVSMKDQAAATADVEKDAQAQVKEELRATRFTVLGANTTTTENYPSPPEALTANKVAWIAYFNDRVSYHDGVHKDRTAANDFQSKMAGHALTGDMMKDFTGGYMGPMWHVEKSPGAAAASTAYAILVSAKAKDEESAAQMIELIKANALTQLAAGSIRCTIIPPESEVPGQDKCEVRWCEQYATAEDHAAHKDSTHMKEVGPKVLALMNDPKADYSVIEYASSNHYEKMVEAPSAAPPASILDRGASTELVAPNLHVVTIVWNFLEQEKCDAWLNNFMTNTDTGFRETAEATGITVCRLYQSTDFDSSVGFYEEWDKKDSQKQYAIDRFQSGFMNQWFDIDPKTYKFKNLRTLEDGDAYPPATVQGTIIKGTAKPGAKSPFALTAFYDFVDQADYDAWLSHFTEAEDGFKLAAESEGCNMCKLFKVNESTSKVGLYQEWESEGAYRKRAAQRIESGYLAQWFGFDPATSKYAKLKHEKPIVHGFTMLMSDEKGGVVL
jgi:quinol monooxygenase YgiN